MLLAVYMDCPTCFWSFLQIFTATKLSTPTLFAALRQSRLNSRLLSNSPSWHSTLLRSFFRASKAASAPASFVPPHPKRNAFFHRCYNHQIKLVLLVLLLRLPLFVLLYLLSLYPNILLSCSIEFINL